MLDEIEAGCLAVLRNPAFAGFPVVIKVLGPSRFGKDALDVQIVAGRSPVPEEEQGNEPAVIAMKISDLRLMEVERYVPKRGDPMCDQLDQAVLTVALHYLSFREGMLAALLNQDDVIKDEEEAEAIYELIQYIRMIREDLMTSMDFDVLEGFCAVYHRIDTESEANQHECIGNELEFVDFVEQYLDVRYGVSQGDEEGCGKCPACQAEAAEREKAHDERSVTEGVTIH